HEALWHGVPMVAVPQQIEQLHNAEAMQAAGAGVVIDSEAKGRPATAAALGDAVERVMADRAGYAAAAAAIGTTLREGGGIAEAANIIERHAAGRSGSVQPHGAISTPVEGA